MTTSSARPHIVTLDGLRGLAIFLVFILHTCNLPWQFQRTNSLLKLCGGSGVELFFCLSGFLITGILYDSQQDPHYFLNFYARRTLRIFPLYYLYLVLYYVFVVRLSVFHDDAVKTAGIARDLHWVWFYGANILMFLRGNFITASLTHFWTLSVEEHFYLVWPLLVFWLPWRRLMMTIAAISVGCLLLRYGMQAHGVSGLLIETFTPCRVDSFALGGAASLLLRRASTYAFLSRVTPIATPLSLVLALAVHLGFPSLIDTVGLSLFSIAFSLLLASAAIYTASPWMALFRSTPMRFLGKYSYALYVFHLPVQVAVLHRISVEKLALRWHSWTLAVLFNMTVVASISIVIALLSWNLWEKRFLKLKRYFDARRRTYPVPNSRTPATLPAQP